MPETEFDDPHYVPTLHQIWNVETKKIQAEWSPDVEMSRRVVRPKMVKLHECRAEGEEPEE